MKPLAATLLLALAACGYNPPPNTDTTNPAYQTARDACRSAAVKSVDTTNAKTGLAWMSSPVLRWGEIGDATGSCMDGKGYGRLRWCTPDELRSGTRQSGLVVTSSGVQCSDPPTDPSTRPADTSPPATAPKAKVAKHSS